MAGLLDFLDSPDAQLGLGLLAAGGPSMKPMSFGQRLAGAMQGVQAQRAAAEERALKKQLIEAQIGNYGSEAEYRRAQAEAQRAEAAQRIAAAEQELRKRAALTGLLPGQVSPVQAGGLPGGPTNNNASMIGAQIPVGQDAIRRAVEAGATPAQIQEMLGAPNWGRPKVARMVDVAGGPTGAGQQGMTDFGDVVGAVIPKPVESKIAPNGQVYNGYQLTPGRVFSDPNKAFSLSPDGLPVANTPFQQYELNKARAGATNVSVNTEKQFAGTLAEGIGKQVAAGREEALGAVANLNTINRMDAALNSGKVLAGPMTSAAVTLRQIGSVIGVGGKDNNEVLANTRTTMQGLAQLALNGADQLKGSGQVSDAERRLLRDAASGDIDKMTTTEIRTVMSISKRVSEYKLSQHQANVDRLSRVPGAAPISEFFGVNAPAPADAPVAPSGLPNGWSMREIR